MRRKSAPRDKVMGTFVGTPEVAIRFYRRGSGVRGAMTPGLRAMGPGEGYTPEVGGADDWVMEGIPSKAFQTSTLYSGLGNKAWSASDIHGSDGEVAAGVSAVRSEMDLLGAAAAAAAAAADATAFMGEPGSVDMQCLLVMYGAVPSQPALQMFAPMPQGRSVVLRVSVDLSQVAPLQAFAFCLARIDSLVAGGLNMY